MERSKLKIRMYVLALVFTVIIFSFGLMAGVLLNRTQSSVIDESINKMQESTEGFDLQLLFLDVFKEGNISCKFMNYQMTQLGREAAEIGSLLETYVNSRKFGEEYTGIKKKYTLAIIRDWLIMEKVKQKCGANYSTVLYFYTDKNGCAECESQADVLNYHKKLLGDQLMIFALDSDLNLTVVDALKSSYGVLTYPTLVVNGMTLPGFVNASTFMHAITYAPRAE